MGAAWLADDLGPRYLLVNIPAFHLDAIENGRSVLGMKVVTGKTENKTPVLADEITTVIFSPYWNIPPDILQKETIPQVQKDLGYLERNNIEVIGPDNDAPVDPRSVNWSDVDTRRLRLRQRPGKGNSLGDVKFVFPNHYNVPAAAATHSSTESSDTAGCVGSASGRSPGHAARSAGVDPRTDRAGDGCRRRTRRAAKAAAADLSRVLHGVGR